MTLHLHPYPEADWQADEVGRLPTLTRRHRVLSASPTEPLRVSSLTGNAHMARGEG